MGRIAVIDDSQDVLEILEVVLKDEHEIVTFSDPNVFLHEFRRNSFDLIILDIVMPEMDGYQVIQKLREQDSEVPVIAVSARADPGERNRALQATFADYITKPILDIDGFRSAVYRRLGTA